MIRRVFALFLLSAPVAAQADRPGETSMPRVGAPRALQIVDERGRALEGSLFDAHPTRGGEVLFTRDWENTRNVWVAIPDLKSNGRFPVWRAQPLTRFKAPQWAARPVAIAGERVVCLSNEFNQSVSTLNSQSTARLARIDRRNDAMTPLSREFNRLGDLAVSPDGRTLAFSGEFEAQLALWQLSLNGRGETRDEAQLLARTARRATWLDDSTLLFENIDSKPGVSGLYRLSTNGKSPQLVMSGGGEAGALSSGAGVVVSGRRPNSDTAQLFLLARDGSGLQVLPGTSDARRPAASPDGKSVFFDAPLEADSPNRALWLMPLQIQTAIPAPLAPFPIPDFNPIPAPRTAERERARRAISSDLVGTLIEARRTKGAFVDASAPSFEIIGTLGGAQLQSVRLEAGAGANPTRWTPLSTRVSPLRNGRLAIWTPPSNARGVWTLRLSARDNQSAVQSLLRVELARAPVPVPEVTRQTRRNTTPVADLPPAPTSRSVAQVPPPRFDVEGVPATMAPNGSVRVTLEGADSFVDKNVRLTARWVDFTLGTRHKWNLFGVPGRRPITLVAPARSGQYKLIFALVRVDERGEIVAPAYNAPQQTWENEVASVAFAVEVGAR